MEAVDLEGNIAMRTDQERIIMMHKRAGELKRKRDRMQLCVLSISCMALLVCLTGVTMLLDGGRHGVAAGTAAATSILAESAGGYVLVGVLAFMAGVLITVLILRGRDR